MLFARYIPVLSSKAKSKSFSSLTWFIQSCRRYKNEVAFLKATFGFLNFSFEHIRRDGAFIDVEQRDVVVGNLVQENDELDEVGVGLLPKRFFAATEQVVQKRCDAIRQSVGIQVVMERVVTVVGIEADFYVVFLPCMLRKNTAHLVTEIAFHLEDETTDAFLFVVCLIAEELLREGKMAPLVFPVPTAPKMAMPVKRPRSGMVSHAGFCAGPTLRGL